MNSKKNLFASISVPQTIGTLPSGSTGPALTGRVAVNEIILADTSLK